MQPPTSSVVKALRVLERLSLDQPLGVTELARALDLPKASAHRLLTTLAGEGWARQDPGGGWSLGLRCAEVGRRVDVAPAVVAAALPIMQELAARTSELIRLWLIDGTTFLKISEIESSHAVRPVVPEALVNIPLHATAVGKAAIASWPAPDFERYLAAPLAAMTEWTISNPDDLRTEIRRVQQRGYATSWNESHLDVGGISAVTPVPDGRLAALSVAYPTHRLTNELVESFGRMLISAIQQFQGAMVGNFE